MYVTGVTLFSDIDDCGNVTCLNNGTCRDGINTAHCECRPGYKGDFCQTGKGIGLIKNISTFVCGT